MLNDKRYVWALGIIGLILIVVVLTKIFGGNGDITSQGSSTNLPMISLTAQPALPANNINKKVLQRALDIDTPINMYLQGVMLQSSLENILFDESVTAENRTKFLGEILAIYEKGYQYVGEIGVISEEPLAVRKVFLARTTNKEVAEHLYMFNNCLEEMDDCKITNVQVTNGRVQEQLQPIVYEDYMTNEQKELEAQNADFFPINSAYGD